MRKKILLSIIYAFLIMPLPAFAHLPFSDSELVEIELKCNGVDVSDVNNGFHRSRGQNPNVYLNQNLGVLYFENPCFDCSIELFMPGTDTVVYVYYIPDGYDTIVLPYWLFGEYELHIHRGNLCFWGIIVLN